MEDNPMARTPFGGGKGGDRESQTIFTPPAPSSSASSGGSSPGGLTAFIDQGSEFEGKLSFKDTVRIDGRFRGEISSDVVASSKVVLHKTGRIDGNIETDSIVVEEGAIINGELRMGKAGSSSLKAIPGGGTNEKGDGGSQS
jgi:cytoskeletal protein CcmA (bactofilin family)